jgi:exosortase/archaeosortase family protein
MKRKRVGGRKKAKTGGIKLNRQQRKLFDTLIFLAKLLIFALPLYVIMSLPGLLFPLQEIVSQNVMAMLNFLGYGAVRDGFLLRADEIIFFVSEDCTGWKSMLFLVALMFAVPKVAMRKRLAGAAIGVPLVYLGNLSRILLVISAWKAYGLETALAIHDYFWQAGLISLVLAIWILWLVWAGNIKTTLLKRLHKLIKPTVKR